MTIPSLVIGIAGGTGAGKTTVSREITGGIAEGVTHIPLDNYYAEDPTLSFDERRTANYDHPSAFEWELVVEHLELLLSGRSIEMPQYDFEAHARTDERVTVEPTDVVVVEGLFALYDERLTEMQDLRIYVETDADVRILRRIRRDVLDRGRELEGVIEQYLSTVKPMHEQFVEPTKRRADLILPEGANSVAISLLQGMVDAEFEEESRRWERTMARENDPTVALEYDVD
ncbi:uridine kinase [Natronorarus salvus]|uniref:uridine kinase n=1 Tax=Natronorarus salvus TaxID=3117733 RepID=UPI002F26321C